MTVTPLCPAARLARQLAELWTLSEQLESRQVSLRRDSPEYLRLDAEHLLTQERIDAVEDYLTYTQADSAEGALAQLALASADATSMRDSSGSDEFVERFYRRIERALYSAATYFAASTGQAAPARMTQAYMPERLNPHKFGDRKRKQAHLAGAVS